MKPDQYNILLNIAVLILVGSFASLTWAGQDTSTKIRLAPANDIIGMDIRTSDGKEAGEIEYLLIDGASAEVRYALIEEDGELELEDDELVPLPFDISDFKRTHDDEVSVRVSLEKLRGATRIKEDSISELIKPIVTTEVYDYIIQESEQEISSSKNKSRNQQNDVKKTESDGNEKKEAHHVIITRDIVNTIIPGMRCTDRMRGADVRTQTDKDFGEIDQLVLDLDIDRVAYALIGHGGFQGMGEGWVSIPLERLTWMEDEQAYLADFNTNSSTD